MASRLNIKRRIKIKLQLKRHGFRHRMSTRTWRAILKARMAKWRHSLSTSDRLDRCKKFL